MKGSVISSLSSPGCEDSTAWRPSAYSLLLQEESHVIAVNIADANKYSLFSQIYKTFFEPCRKLHLQFTTHFLPMKLH